MAEESASTPTLYCSFCGKSRQSVKLLIASPAANTHICNECVGQCVQICLNKFGPTYADPLPGNSQEVLREFRKGLKIAKDAIKELDAQNTMIKIDLPESKT